MLILEGKKQMTQRKQKWEPNKEQNPTKLKIEKWINQKNLYKHKRNKIDKYI